MKLLILHQVICQLRQITEGAKGYSAPPPPPELLRGTGGGQPVPMHMGYGVAMI